MTDLYQFHDLPLGAWLLLVAGEELPQLLDTETLTSERLKAGRVTQDARRRNDALNRPGHQEDSDGPE